MKSDNIDIVSKLRDDAFVCHIGNLARESKLLHAAADEIERLRAERDEARREVCNNEAKHLPTMADPQREAKRRGWDCFKETQ